MPHPTRVIPFLLLTCALSQAEKLPTAQLLAQAQKNSPELEQSLRDTFTDAVIAKGTAFAGEGPDFIFAVTAAQAPQIRLDLMDPVPARKLGGLWIYQAKLRAGT